LGQLLGITQRTVTVVFSQSKGTFSPRKLIPVNPKTLGDYILIKRIQADLTQPELAGKVGISARKVSAWEHDQVVPTIIEWQILAHLLNLDFAYPKA
jgi:DNA-binding XRE family transcriptional regulator